MTEEPEISPFEEDTPIEESPVEESPFEEEPPGEAMPIESSPPEPLTEPLPAEMPAEEPTIEEEELPLEDGWVEDEGSEAEPTNEPAPEAADPDGLMEENTNPLNPAGDSIDRLIELQINEDVWISMLGDLPCLDASELCVRQLQELAIGNSPELVAIDERVALVQEKIDGLVVIICEALASACLSQQSGHSLKLVLQRPSRNNAMQTAILSWRAGNLAGLAFSIALPCSLSQEARFAASMTSLLRLGFLCSQPFWAAMTNSRRGRLLSVI